MKRDVHAGIIVATVKTGPLQNEHKMLPPVLTTIHDQTGMKPFKHLVDMNKKNQ